MKRKTLNFVMLCIITLSFASGCTKNVDNGLTIDGKEVIVKVGDEYFTADQLFGEMSVSTTNIKTFYEEVKKIVIKKDSPADSTMRYSVNAEVESWEAKIKNSSLQSGISYKEAKAAALESEGVSSIEELTEKKLFALQKEKTTNKYWREMEDEYFDNYILENMPFHISQIFVSVSSASQMDDAMKTIDESTAKKLAEISTRLINGEKFYNVASAFSDDEESKQNGGDLGLVNLKSEIKDEVKLALISYVMYGENQETIIEKNDYLTSYYESGIEGIPLSYMNQLEELSKDTSRRISDYDYSVERFYPRSIIFNNLFNTKGFRYLVNDDDQPSVNSNIVSMDNIKLPNIIQQGFGAAGSCNVVLNSSDNPILVVRSNDGVYFISINKTPYDQDLIDYYSKNPSKTDDYLSFIELGSTEKIQNQRKDLVSSFSKEAATLSMYGFKNDDYIDYDMVKKYMEQYGVNIINEELAIKMDMFLNEKILYQKQTTINKLQEKINVISTYIESSKRPLIQKELVPFICISNKNDCKHQYSTGIVYTAPAGGGGD